MREFITWFCLPIVLFIAVVALGTDWERGAERTERVCVDALLVTGDHKRFTVMKPPYSELGISASGGKYGGMYYLQGWERGRFMFIPLKWGFIVKYGVVDFDYC